MTITLTSEQQAWIDDHVRLARDFAEAFEILGARLIEFPEDAVTCVRSGLRRSA